jgi:glycine betaine catabolism A
MNVVTVRGSDGGLAAFHNVCRHRGAEICAQGAGALRRPLLTCPYHAWTYDLAGRLLAIGHARAVEGFDRADHGLVPLGLAEWGGLVFVNAHGSGQGVGQAEFDTALGADLSPLANWPLASLQPVRSETTEIACNWKVFWENFNECLHCPGVHKELSELVPIYGRGIMVREDDPDWRSRADSDDPRVTGRLRDGAESWTADGRAVGPTLPGLAAGDVARGHTYAVALPSLFVVGHADHARVMRVLPLAPERTLVEATWLLPPDRIGQVDLDRLTGLARHVIAEDAAACETNQRGLSAAPFEAGTLMGEEYEVHAFHAWLRARLGEPVAEASSRSYRRG